MNKPALPPPNRPDGFLSRLLHPRSTLARILEPNMRFYFLVLALYALAALKVSPPLAAAETAGAALVYYFFRRGSKRRTAQVLQYIDSVTGTVETASKSNLINSPLPTMVFRPDTGEVIWCNGEFLNLSGQRERLFETRLEETAPGFPVQWLLEGQRECPTRVELNGRRFRVSGSLVRSRGKGGGRDLLATTYWVDMTEADAVRTAFQDSRLVVVLLVLDNYEDFVKACGEAKRSAVLAQIEEKIGAWAERGLFLRLQRDRYICLFEERDFRRVVEEKFSILDAVREIKVGEGISPTLSIGAGRDAEGIPDLYKSAGLSLDMAFSRGGDQAVVRDRVDFSFYGGRNRTAEKRTKVKSRVMANALSELLEDAADVYVMGHAMSDMDAVGAAAGVCCAARMRGKKPHIVIDADRTAARVLIDLLSGLPEYDDVFLDPEEAFLRLRPGTLLVVVDTNRPDMVESPQILESCSRIAVIDHHRRAARYIENAAFSYHEIYASSASELVTELLQYMDNPAELKSAEAEAMLAGIVLDTKHFTQRTGGRTFEAAAFLRRAGADTEKVQRFFQNGLDEMVARYGIIRRAELVRNGEIAVAAADEDVDRVTASQAADELLTLKGVDASFVLYRNGEDVLMSGRSLGDINVQVILEKLGGGGNAASAGGRVPGAELADVRARLMQAIDSYFEK